MYNHYFYDHQGEIVEQLQNYPIQLQKSKAIMFTGADSTAVYMIQAELHIQNETPATNSYNWLVTRLTKLQVNMSYIDTTSPRPFPATKSTQGFTYE